MLRIIIADDHNLFRAGLKRLVETWKDIQLVGEAGGGRETVELCRELKPDVILLDLDMPDMDGFETTQHILNENPDIKILILTMHEHDEYAFRLLKAGVKGYVVKDIDAEQLPVAIRKVAAGGTYVSPTLIGGIASRASHKEDNPLAVLSDREIQIISMLASGKKSSEIAQELCISARTVGTYRTRSLNKLGLRTLSDLTRFAIQHGLIKSI